MKLNLPIIGPVSMMRGEPKATVQTVEKISLGELGASFLDLSSSSLSNYKTVSERLLKSFEGWVYANVSVLAEEISKIEFELYAVKLIKGQIEYEKVTTHPILDLLDRFNPFTTTSQAMYMTEAHLELAGDTFYLLDSATNPQNIFILEPDKITVNPGGKEAHYQIKNYTYRTKENGKNVDTTYEADVVIQFKNPNPNNPYRGQSVVEAAALTIDTDNLAGEFLKSFFKNGAVPNFALSSEGRITKDDIERITTDLKRTYGGVRNAFKTLILGGGLKPVTVQQSGKEMQFLEIELAMRDKLIALFKNTKASLGITDDVNRSNAEASLLSWKQSVVKPKMTRITDTLNEFLVPRFGTNLILGFKDPVPENRLEKVEEVKTLVADAKVMTVNEGRGLLGLDPLVGEEFDTIQSQQPVQVPPTAPKSLQNVSYVKHLRRQGIFKDAEIDSEIYTAAKTIATKVVKSNKKAEPKEEPRRYRSYTNDQADEYWTKQIQITEVVEARFKTKLDTFLDKLEDKAVSNLQRQMKKVKAFELFNEGDEIQSGIDLFTPLTEEIAALSGSEAYALLKLQTLYSASPDLKKQIRANVEKFTQSFIQTDREKLTDILVEGIKEGDSIAQIERRIRSQFGEFKRVQSQRIARTEILRASNDGALDAFEQSGVVEGKQWYTAQDERVGEECAIYDMKIVILSENFYSDTSEFADGDPPLHVNCRCVVLPVLAEVKSMTNDKELAEVKAYAEELEKLLEIDNGRSGE